MRRPKARLSGMVFSNLLLAYSRLGGGWGHGRAVVWDRKHNGAWGSVRLHHRGARRIIDPTFLPLYLLTVPRDQDTTNAGVSMEFFLAV